MKLDLEALHRDILYVADEFHKFCEDNEITYYLFGGTALGAMRHGGFIPWDDDFDVCMDFENYSRFIEIWPRQGGHGELYLQQEGTVEWPLYFSKLRLNGSIYIETQDVGRKMHNGVYIDIMCLNKLSNVGLLRRLQFICAKVLCAEALPRRGYVAKGLKRKTAVVASRLLVKLFGAQCFLSVVRHWNRYEGNQLVGHFFGRASFLKSLIPQQVLDDRCLVDFSGRKYFAFKDISEYLTGRYGSKFMDMPSEAVKAQFPSHCIRFEARG
jgi:lipopolysaccharide cholinephosphotransferase